jgi:hypothetical protein
VNVLLIGLPHFTRRTARFLADRSPRRDRFVALDNSTPSGRARFLVELPRADTVLTFWGTLRPSRALELSLRLGKRVVQVWAGSDVLDAIAAGESDAAVPELLHDCVHLCESEWTRDELASAGVEAHVVPIGAMGSVAPDAAQVEPPPTFSILAYVGEGREDFYGLPKLVRLAEDFPHLRVRVAGIGPGSNGLPPNLEPVGWREDMSALYGECALFVRIPDHDGCSFAVREALAWGRHVVASYPYRHCLQAADYESLRAQVGGLEARFEAGALAANAEGREFVLREYADARVYSGLRSVLAGPRAPAATRRPAGAASR